MTTEINFFDSQPKEATRKAITELEAGKGKRFACVNDLMADLHSDGTGRICEDWDVVDVQQIAPLALRVQFADGTIGQVKFEKSHLTGAFAALSDPTVFAKVHVSDGAVVWPGDLDLAPDAMYQEIKKKGEWVLS